MIYLFSPNYFHSGETRFLLIFIDFNGILHLKINNLKLNFGEVIWRREENDQQTGLAV
jgi:hypothetical protein